MVLAVCLAGGESVGRPAGLSARAIDAPGASRVVDSAIARMTRN